MKMAVVEYTRKINKFEIFSNITLVFSENLVNIIVQKGTITNKRG